MTFGYSDRSAEIFLFSFANLLTYLLVVAGIVFTVLSFIGKLGKIVGIIAAVCFIVAGVFFFCTIKFVSLSEAAKVYFGGDNGMIKIPEAYHIREPKFVFSLGSGAIGAGIFSVISAALCAVKTFVFCK